MKRKYVLVLQKQILSNRFFLYRKNGSFKYTYRLEKRNLFYWWEAWYWYLVIICSGRRGSQRLFAYKQPEGQVFVRRLE